MSRRRSKKKCFFVVVVVVSLEIEQPNCSHLKKKYTTAKLHTATSGIVFYSFPLFQMILFFLSFFLSFN